MGKSRPKPQPAPDPVATARAQGAANREAGIASQELSMVDQITPYGNLIYDQTGTSEAGNPRYTATQTLSPVQQRILDQQNRAAEQYGATANRQLANVSGALARPIDYSGLGPAPVANEATRTATRDAILARLEPQFDRRRDALRTSLVNQGFEAGTAGYDEAMDEFTRAQNDAFLAADAQAGDEMARMYGLEASQRDRAISELNQQRQIPLNELAAMMTGTQVQAPQFVSTPRGQVNPADIMGATYASAGINQQNYAQEMANRRASMGGLYGILGAGVGGLSRGFKWGL